ncbi:hypothetical protein ACLMJK_008228 [Lecanora helva]
MSAEPTVLLSDEHPRKKMRKGTHSCTECRRRKKSCIASPEAPNICTECLARGVECREQQPESGVKRPAPDSKQNLQHRVAELEAALHSVISKLDSNSPKQESSYNATPNASSQAPSRGLPTPSQSHLPAQPLTPAASTAASVPSPETRLENAPVLSLFDNSILSRLQEDKSNENLDNGTTLVSESDIDPSAKIDSIRRTLLTLFPEMHAVRTVLKAAQVWWDATQAMFPGIYGLEGGGDLEAFVTQSRTSGSVQKITKALLCISISIQEAPRGCLVDLGPSFTNSDPKKHIMNVLHDLVISDDDIAGTLDGVECLFMHAKHDTNEGRLRRAWLTIRRGLSFAQLLGLSTRPCNARFPDAMKARRRSLWKALYQSDRYLSLLLGLPYAVSESHYKTPGEDDTAQDSKDMSLTGEEYIYRLSDVIGHIIDRNQEPPSSNTLPLTVKIEDEMTELADSMPQEWWSTAISPEDIKDQTYNRLLPQIWHHQVRTMLHLPFMLKAATDRRFMYNRIAALESAREMITRYLIFRPAAGFASSVCKVVDFQVFTAAMVLVLNFLNTSPTSPAHDQQEAATDERLIADTQDVLHRASIECGGGVTTQAARALKIFCKEKVEPCPYGQTTASLVIPYFGRVVFARGKSFANQAYLGACDTPQQPAQLPTPETDSLNGSVRDPSIYEASLASMPSDLNFSGYQMQQPQGVGFDGDVFANVNLDLDQDWSWFWDNTNIA